MTSSVAGLRRSSKALPKATLHSKKGHGHWLSAAALIHYSFLSAGETITSEKHAQQTQWDALKTAMPAAGIGLQKGPNSFAW